VISKNLVNEEAIARVRLQLHVNIYIYIYIYIHGGTNPGGPGPPHHQGFTNDIVD
jgi:hypothetical protein